MSTPITESIAENIKTAINAITITNEFNQDLTAMRKQWVDFDEVASESGRVLIMMDTEEKPDQSAGAAEWIQNYRLLAIVAETNPDNSIELKMQQARDDIRKKLMEDYTRDSNAADTILGPATPRYGARITAIEIEIGVRYRTQQDDPYTKV